MYTFESRIRYSEVDYQEKLTLAGLLDYFQDASTFQSEDLGIGLSFMRQHGYVWVLNMWQIDISRFPELGERVTIGTAPYEMRGFLGYRNFAMTDAKGIRVAAANTIWSLLHTETGKTVFVPEEISGTYQMEEKIEMEYMPRKIIVPELGSQKDKIIVAPHHLDTNRHVNNGSYVRMAMDFLPQGMIIRRMRAEYKAQAFLNDEIWPVVSTEVGKITVALNNAAGKLYSVIELTG